mgnify:CR=1 FL=1
MNVKNLSMGSPSQTCSMNRMKGCLKHWSRLEKAGGYFVFVIPIHKELDLKKAARAVHEKSVEMIHVKDITAVTGYVRGGCSPIGMKKQFPTVVEQSAGQFDRIYVSGGRIGTTLVLAPEDLLKVSRAEYGDFAFEE